MSLSGLLDLVVGESKLASVLEDVRGGDASISAERLIQFENGGWKPIGQLVDPRPSRKTK